jgi:potassium efflux system protein
VKIEYVKIVQYQKIRSAAFGLMMALVFFWNAAAAADKPKNTPAGPSSPYADPNQSLDKSIAAEQETIGQLREELRKVQDSEKETCKELDGFKIKIPACNSLLTLAAPPVDDLEKVRLDNLVAMEWITKHLKELKQKRDAIDQLRVQTDELYSSNQKQLNDIKGKNSETEKLLKKLQNLGKILSDKRVVLEKIYKAYTDQITRLQDLQEKFTVFAQKFDQRIKERKKQELFRRKTDPLGLLSWTQIKLEVQRLAEQARLLVSADFWARDIPAFWQTGRFLFITFALLLGVLQILFFRIQRLLRHMEERPFYRQKSWRYLTLKLFHRSLPLLGATLFIYIYAQARLLFPAVPLVRVIIYVLLIWLFTRWMLDFMKLLGQNKDMAVTGQFLSYLQALLLLIRFFAIPYVILQEALGGSSVILLLGRVIFEISLLAWCALSLKAFRETIAPSLEERSLSGRALKPLLAGLCYFIAGAGFFLELSGYGQLALHWYVSWGRSAVILLWGVLIILFLKEWDNDIPETCVSDKNGPRNTSHPVRWLFIRVAWLAVVGMIIFSLFLAWGTKERVILSFLNTLNYRISLGAIRFSLLGVVYAFLILLLTHAAVRPWRRIFKNRILAGSGLELGVQESVTTITVYLIWMIAILATLYAIGINTTSLAVVFGALSIGLGFGLQNIFNNFVSGLILLFERPIQVGDAIEINGIWGIIQKINVRATVVQTYDNASLIIPNSEFISGQVTNWSFKDLRVRRKITVGVSYESDVESVKQTLLEIAAHHSMVLSDPKPDVLFNDFGDSALIFILRIWTTVDVALSTETSIRFEINRLFRERHIEIPFPQHDIHFRSVLEQKTIEQIKKETGPALDTKL